MTAKQANAAGCHTVVATKAERLCQTICNVWLFSRAHNPHKHGPAFTWHRRKQASLRLRLMTLACTPPRGVGSDTQCNGRRIKVQKPIVAFYESTCSAALEPKEGNFIISDSMTILLDTARHCSRTLLCDSRTCFLFSGLRPKIC